MTQLIEQPNDIVAAPAPPSSPLCDVLGCGEFAKFHYVWEWGETGVVCPKHQALYLQRAPQLGRTIQFSLISNEPPPLERSERIQLRATAMVLEAELSDARLRGADLLTQTERLSRQAALYAARDAEQKAQLVDAKVMVERLTADRDAREGQVAQLSSEIADLRAFMPTVRQMESTDELTRQLADARSDVKRISAERDRLSAELEQLTAPSSEV